MILRSIQFALACGFCIVGTTEMSALAATSKENLTQYTQSNVNRGSISLEPSTSKSTPERIKSGNPLWSIPLGSLSITRERPIFTPSRRAPQPAVHAAPRVAPPPPQVARPVVLEHPNLVLIGTVNGADGGIGVFLDQTTKDLIRLRTGEGHSGWVLQSVRAREATLEKGNQTETLSFPASHNRDLRAPFHNNPD